MKSKPTKQIELFAELGNKLLSFGTDALSRDVIACAVAANEWFTAEDVAMAVDAIRRKMLSRESLTDFVDGFRNEESRGAPKNVAVIMAGNIPAVCFADMLYVLVTGNRCHYKPSSKDSELMRYLVDTIRETDPDAALFEYDPAKRYDAVIATGSDTTVQYFSGRYVDTPSLLRGSRYSVAVIAGGETDDTIEGLAADIFSYSGLGCRNVSLLFVPREYDVKKLAFRLNSKRRVINPLYLGDYRQLRALALMLGEEFTDGGSFLLKPADVFSDRIGVVNYARYDTLSEVEKWLAVNDSKLQCVAVDDYIEHPRRVRIGQTQYPTLYDYADGRNVVEFLFEV